MPIQPMYFQPLSFDQANPVLTGAQRSEQIAGGALDNQAKAIANAINKASIPYTPYKFLSPWVGNIARMQSAYNSSTSILNRLTQNPQIAGMLQDHPELTQAIYDAAQNQGAVAGMGAPFTGMQIPGLPQGAPQGIPGNNPAQLPQNLNYPQLPLSNNQIDSLKQRFQPGGGLTQNDIQNAQNAQSLKLQKDTTDSAARQKNLYATNIEKTLAQINPDDLTQYAGLSGGLSKYWQQGKAALGKESTSYDDYTKSANAANLLATQVRQFYGDSIQPSMIQRLEALTNPSMWSNNPKLAKQLFDETKNILGQETQTYRDAMTSTAPYKSQTQNIANTLNRQAQANNSDLSAIPTNILQQIAGAK